MAEEKDIARLLQKASESRTDVTYDQLLKASKALLGELRRYRESTVSVGCEELSCGAKNEINLGSLMDQLY